MLHPDHTSLFLETVRRKFMGRGVEGPTADIWGRGPKKPNALLTKCFHRLCYAVKIVTGNFPMLYRCKAEILKTF